MTGEANEYTKDNSDIFKASTRTKENKGKMVKISKRLNLKFPIKQTNQ